MTVDRLPKRSFWLLLTAYALTRLALGFLAIHPEHYGEGNEGLANDVYAVYQGWAEAVVHDGRAPYSGVPIEYPPGSLPFVLLPEVVGPEIYQTTFVLIMLVVDLAGLLGLLSLARRGGSLLGAWLWVAGIPLLGPISFVRLDLAPAVLSVWAYERAAARRWAWSGAFLGYAALTKLYPLLFLPSLIVRSPGKRQFVFGAAVAIGLPLLPLLGGAEAIVRSVVGYHIGRGVQIESVWGAALLMARVLGRPIEIVHNFGAFHLAGYPPAIDLLSGLLTVGVIAFAAWLVGRKPDPPMALRSDGALASLLLALALTTVLSPQFIIWAVAAAAVAASSAKTRLRLAAVLTLGVATLTQWVFPFLYDGLLASGTDRFALAVLIARNVALMYVALEAVFALVAVGEPRAGAHEKSP